MKKTLLLAILVSMDVLAANPESLSAPPSLQSDTSTYSHLRSAQDLIDKNRTAEAGRSIERIQNPGDWDFWYRVLKARVLMAQNQALGSLELLATLPAQPDISLSPTETFYRTLYKQALQTIIDATQTLGRDTSSLESQIWGLFPDLDSRLVSNPNPVDRINRLHVLHELKKFTEVPDILSDPHSIAHANLSDEVKCRALSEWATSMRQLKNSAQALQGYSLVISMNCKGEELARSYYWKGKLEAGNKNTGAAIATYKEFLRHFPTGRYTDDAYYALATLYEKNGSADESKKMMTDLMAMSQGDMKAKVIWDLAYAAYKKKDYREAISLWDKMEHFSNSHDETQPQAMYWKARATENLGDSSYKGLYKNVKDSFPFSYYGVLAARKLGSTTPDLSPPSITSDSAGSEILKQVSSLNNRNLNAQAREALDYYVQTHQDHAVSKPIAFKYYESGDYHRAMMMAHEILDTGPSSAVFDKNDPMVRLLFPVAFPSEVKQASIASGLPQGAIQGIMREESLFQVGVRSHAGAMGLMQLMPGTASMQARSMGMSFDLGQVTNPRTNIRLGSAFFDKMVSSFGNHIPLAIMAYNAGPGNVRKWLKTNGHLPLDEFVEEIPFAETKGYIKRVLRSVQVYGHLCHDDKLSRPFFTLNLP